MKRTKLIALIPMVLLAGSLTSCGKKIYTIGILQQAEFSALSDARLGFIQGLKEAGLEEGKDFKINYHNGNGQVSEFNYYAKDLVGSSNMTFGIATGAAKALYSAALSSGNDNPLLFTAVTDPVAAGLVDSLDNGFGFVTGTSDAQPIDAQIQLIREIIPSADKIGIFYTQSEENSVIQAAQAKAAAENLGLEVVTKTTFDSSDLPANILDLAQTSGIDAIFLPTDNNVASHMTSVKTACNDNNVLLVCGEEGMLNDGGHVTLSVDYKNLGVLTGKMAAKIIKGEAKAGEIPVATMSKEECSYIYSSANLNGTSITLPQTFLDKATDCSGTN